MISERAFATGADPLIAALAIVPLWGERERALSSGSRERTRLASVCAAIRIVTRSDCLGQIKGEKIREIKQNHYKWAKPYDYIIISRNMCVCIYISSSLSLRHSLHLSLSISLSLHPSLSSSEPIVRCIWYQFLSSPVAEVKDEGTDNLPVLRQRENEFSHNGHVGKIIKGSGTKIPDGQR